MDSLKENLEGNLVLNEKEEAEMKKRLKNITKVKETNMKQTENDITRRKARAAENQKVYEKLSKDVSKYQEDVNKQREADIIDFTKNQSDFNF